MGLTRIQGFPAMDPCLHAESALPCVMAAANSEMTLGLLRRQDGTLFSQPLRIAVLPTVPLLVSKTSPFLANPLRSASAWPEDKNAQPFKTTLELKRLDAIKNGIPSLT